MSSVGKCVEFINDEDYWVKTLSGGTFIVLEEDNGWFITTCLASNGKPYIISVGHRDYYRILEAV